MAKFAESILGKKEQELSKVFSETDIWEYIKSLETKVTDLSEALQRSIEKSKASESAVTEGFKRFLSQKSDTPTAIINEVPKEDTQFTKEKFEEVSTMLSEMKIETSDNPTYECTSGTTYNVNEAIKDKEKLEESNLIEIVETVEIITEISPQEAHYVNENYGYMIPDKKIWQLPDPDYFESEEFKQLKLQKLDLHKKCEWCDQHAVNVQFKSFDNVKDASAIDLWALCTWHFNECHKLENIETPDFKINWVLESPNGFTFKLTSLPKFSESNLLHSATLGMVARGSRTHHKGWNCYKYTLTP